MCVCLFVGLTKIQKLIDFKLDICSKWVIYTGSLNELLYHSFAMYDINNS